jgi:hypothetical protein
MGQSKKLATKTLGGDNKIGKLKKNPYGVNICSNWGGGRGPMVVACEVEIWVCRILAKSIS